MPPETRQTATSRSSISTASASTISFDPPIKHPEHQVPKCTCVAVTACARLTCSMRPNQLVLLDRSLPTQARSGSLSSYSVDRISRLPFARNPNLHGLRRRISLHLYRLGAAQDWANGCAIPHRRRDTSHRELSLL